MRSQQSTRGISIVKNTGILIVLCAGLVACTEESPKKNNKNDQDTGIQDVEFVDQDTESDQDTDTPDVKPGDLNVCGGTEVLEQMPGDACGPCNLDMLQCDGQDAVVCDGNTACPDLLIETLPVEDISANEATFLGEVTELPAVSVEDHGFCFAHGDDEEVCRSLGVLSEVGSFSLVESALLPGRTYDVRAYATVGTETAYGTNVEFTTAALNVTGFEASQGESSAHVRLNWEEIDGVETYVLYRDDEEIARIDGAEKHYLDTHASPGSAPSGVSDVTASQGDFADHVLVNWEPATFLPGAEHTYQLVAEYPDAESDKTAGVEGFRKAFDLKGYEISINGAAFVDAGVDSEYEDFTTVAGEITAAEISASNATHIKHVVLSILSHPTMDMYATTYVIRAVSTQRDEVDDVAVMGPESAPVGGFRSTGDITLQWESSATIDGNFTAISGATTPSYNHTGARQDGTPRYYRAKFSSAGVNDVYSLPVPGSRAFLSLRFVEIPSEADIKQPFSTEIEVTNQLDAPFEGVSVSMMLRRDTVMFFMESFGTQTTDAQGRATFSHAAPVPWPGVDFLFEAKLPDDRLFHSDIFRVDRAPIFVGSSSATNVAGDERSGGGQISADGRYLVFSSEATNLTTGTLNGHAQIYRKDLMEGTVQLVSLTQAGVLANAASSWPVTSADGRFVAFTSNATNLSPEVTSDTRFHIYVKDMSNGSLRLVSADAAGVPSDWGGLGPVISADGRYVAFESRATTLVAQDTNWYAQVYRKDLQTNAIELVSHVSGAPLTDEKSGSPAISADGRYVAFSSLATNLVPGVTHRSESEVFVRDMNAGGVIKLVSTDASDVPAAGYSASPTISADGRYVAFLSRAKDFAGHANPSGAMHFYHKDLVSGALVHVTANMAGEPANGHAQLAVMSADGRFVAFESSATNYVTGATGTHIYRKDVLNGKVVLVSTNADGIPADNSSNHAAISGDGRYLTFSTSATNLVAGTPPASQVYIRRVLVD